jgi:hypothetical protein
VNGYLSGMGRAQCLDHRPAESMASLRKTIARRDRLPTPAIETRDELALDHALPAAKRRAEAGFAPLRDRPDFPLPSMDLAFPADPFAG